MSNNLVKTTVAASQNQKEVTINDADGILDAAITEDLAVAITSSNARTLNTTEFTQNFFFIVDEDGGDPADAAITLTVPAVKRGTFQVLNNTAFDVTVEINSQPVTAPVIAAGEVAQLTCDGTNVRQPASAGGASDFLSLTDTPSSYSGAGNRFVKVNSGATALEFVAGSGDGSSEGRPPFRGALLKLGGTFTTSGSSEVVDPWGSADYDTGYNGLKFWLGPDLTFTADNTTERLSATAHDMQTGDGPFRLTNSGGALPTGLSAGTNYWCIRIDANTLQVASSYANAIALTPVAFTTDGTGTHTLDRASRLVVPGDGSVTKVRLQAGLDSASSTTNEGEQIYITQDGGAFPGHALMSVVMGTSAGSRGMQVLTPVLEVTGGEYFEVNVDLDPDLDATDATFFSIEVLEDVDTAAYDFGGFLNGSPTSSQVVFRYVFPRTVVLPANATDSQFVAGTAATAQTDFDLQKNGVSFGTARFAAAGSVATYVGVSEQTFSQGDTMEVVAPGSADATLADLYFTFAGRR